MSKHFTTNGRIRDERLRKANETMRIERERRRRAQERRELLALQRKFAERSGR